MIVRLKFRLGAAVSRKSRKNQPLALACAALLAPASLIAYVLGFWRLTSDLGATREFAFTGVLSHWQVWIATAAVLHAAAVTLNRYGNGGKLRLPRIFALRFGRVNGPDKAPPNALPPRRQPAASRQVATHRPELAPLPPSVAPFDRPRPRAR